MDTLSNRTVLVTGANGGLGAEFVGQALARGARRVYATARSPKGWGDERVVPITLDVRDPDSIARAAVAASDVELVINNAGIAPVGDVSLTGAGAELVQSVLETNALGTLRVSTAFAPQLAANGGGALLNVLSLAAWVPLPTVYAVSKAAAWSVTNGLRSELAAQGTTVTGLIVGMVDTPMSARWEVPKVSAASVVAAAYDGVLAGDFEVLADEPTRLVKSLLASPAEELAAAVAQEAKAVTD